MEWLIGCDHNIWYGKGPVDGAKDARTGLPLNALTVSYRFYDSDDEELTEGAVSMPYVSSSNGNYLGVLPAAITTELEEGEEYYAIITVTGGYDDERKLTGRAAYRERT